MQKNLAIIGASYFQLPLIEKAKEMGYTTHVFAWAANDVGESVADYFYPISIIEKEEILKKCEEIGICGICSIASDLAMVTVNYVAQSLGLNSNSVEATKVSTNKHLMRKAFEERNDPSPKSVLVDENSDVDNLEIEFPVIVKPTDRSGSRGIFKAESREQLSAAVRHAIECSFEKKALVEEFVQGTEYSVEFISYKGQHHYLTTTLKYTTGAPNFIETGHRQPAPIDKDTEDRIKSVISHALDTLSLENGASHSEIKIDDNGKIKLIEIGGRMGGDCIGSDLVPCSTGYDFVRMVIEVACDIPPSFEKVCEPQSVESVFIFSKEDLMELERIKAEEPDSLIRIADLSVDKIGTTTDSSNRAGCYIKKFKGV